MRMSELLNEVRNFELDEGFSPKEIKMAIGIASDPRYAKGNMTGAVNAIERMKTFTSPTDSPYRMMIKNAWGEMTEKDDKSGKELNNPTRGDVKKYKVYVKNDKGNVVKVEFGDPNMEIKRDDPERRKSFRARHNCDNPGPKYKARYWSCKFWEKGKSVSDLMKG